MIPGFLARVPAIRRHHALEHATIAVLFQRRGRMVSVLGRSDFGGFHLYGPFSPQEVESAAAEALERLRSGESYLAITPLCGTNIAVTGILAGSAALLAAGHNRRGSWSRAITAAVLATLVAGRVGSSVQRYITTDAAMDGVRVRTVEELPSRAGSRHVRVSIES